MDLQDWLDRVSEERWTWCVKRLSANDTGASGSHQAGIYLPPDFLFALDPGINTPGENTDRPARLAIVSDEIAMRPCRVRYYGASKKEGRLVRLGRGSPLRDPGQTGRIAFFAAPAGSTDMECWLATEPEAELIESFAGLVETDTLLLRRHGIVRVRRSRSTAAPSCATLEMDDLPPAWRTSFPRGSAIAAEARNRVPRRRKSTDALLVARADCEFQIFMVVEDWFIPAEWRTGFESKDAFKRAAQSYVQRRRSRAGFSLEQHVAAALEEAEIQFERQGRIGSGRPDFVFPSVAAYKAATEPSDRIAVLAVKRTLRERWPQALLEAPNAGRRYLLTLEGGMPAEKCEAILSDGRTRLVVPSSLQRSYPDRYRPQILNVEQLLGELRALEA